MISGSLQNSERQLLGVVLTPLKIDMQLRKSRRNHSPLEQSFPSSPNQKAFQHSDERVLHHVLHDKTLDQSHQLDMIGIHHPTVLVCHLNNCRISRRVFVMFHHQRSEIIQCEQHTIHQSPCPTHLLTHRCVR
jgi:hypothetical protein